MRLPFFYHVSTGFLMQASGFRNHEKDSRRDLKTACPSGVGCTSPINSYLGVSYVFHTFKQTADGRL